MMPTPKIPTTTAAPNADALFTDVYARLKAMAGRQLNQSRANATLQTTGLVHELYLRMCANRELAFESQAQFFTYAARAMRHLLSDRARDRMTQHAGGQWVQITLTASDVQLALDSAEQAIALDTALTRLEEIDARAARVLELRYFAGLTSEQAAETLGIARRTAQRDWEFAHAFLKTDMA
jgi:RNA polymerase sigma factor (TIGR02999 family)